MATRRRRVRKEVEVKTDHKMEAAIPLSHLFDLLKTGRFENFNYFFENPF